jgi:hypothetical protein
MSIPPVDHRGAFEDPIDRFFLRDSEGATLVGP